MDNELINIKKVAEETAREAGRYMVSRLGTNVNVSQKDGINNIVTEVDKKSEEMIMARIRKEFPEHSILAEESGELNLGDGYRWVIDPLDGTTNYAHKFPVFCVSLGIMKGVTSKVGVVYDPTRDEMFTAVEGKGAFLNGKKISVSSLNNVHGALMATGFSYSPDSRLAGLKYFEKMLTRVQGIRRPGSAALDLCYVACGRFDGFWEFGLNPWDTAAAYLVVKEAGGRVTKLDGAEYDVFQKEIVASNGHIHDEMMNILNK